MELRDYVKVYWHQRWFIVILTLVTVAVTYGVVATRPERVAVTSSFAVNRVTRESTPDYQYDGYYALQATELFSQTVVSWFNTAPVLQEMYRVAELDPEISSASQLPGRFAVKRYSPQNIVIRFTESTTNRAKLVAAAMREVMETRASQLNLGSDGQPLFEIVGTEPVLTPSQPNPWLWSGVALVLGLLLSMFVVLTRHYLRA